MDTLRRYINDMNPSKRDDFARRCGTTVGYLRKAICAGQKLGESLVINIERESGGVITCEELRPDVDWAYLRNTKISKQEAA